MGKKNKSNHDKAIAANYYSAAFRSIQLSALYCLYYEEEFDFSKQQIKNYNKILTQHNFEIDSCELDADVIESQILESVKFNCKKEALEFPFRSKLFMVGKKVKPSEMKIAVENINRSIEFYLILSIYTLKKNYRFSNAKIYRLWNSIKQFCHLYSDGMEYTHVIEYFKQECDLEITE